MRAVGLVANPASGKDIRRLTGKASVFDNREKLAIVRRAVVGAIAAGAGRLRAAGSTARSAAHHQRPGAPSVPSTPLAG